MPQRKFWTTRHPQSITLVFAVNATDPDGDPLWSVKIADQAGSCMSWGGGSLPAGFAAWAFADLCRAVMEAFELGEPEDAKRAASRVAAQWRRDAKAINQQ